MEAFSKVLELLSRSIKSLRWWALVGVITGAYLKYAPDKFLIFVDRDFLMQEDRSEWVGIGLLISAVVFVLGWVAAAVDGWTARYRRETARKEGRRRDLLQQRNDLRRRRREKHLVQRREEQILQSLTGNQKAMVNWFLEATDGIRKINNDAGLDIATLLTSKNILERIRPWYNDHGGIIGEVFVVREWVRRCVQRLTKAQVRAEQPNSIQ